jgi:hypothetical protein
MVDIKTQTQTQKLEERLQQLGSMENSIVPTILYKYQPNGKRDTR